MVLWKGLSVGSMTIFISAADQFYSSLGSVSNSYLKLTENALRISDYIEFISIPQRQYMSGNKVPIFNKDSVLEFRNISFRYPGSQRYAIKNLNIHIRGDEKHLLQLCFRIFQSII